MTAYVASLLDERGAALWEQLYWKAALLLRE